MEFRRTVFEGVGVCGFTGLSTGAWKDIDFLDGSMIHYVVYIAIVS